MRRKLQIKSLNGFVTMSVRLKTEKELEEFSLAHVKTVLQGGSSEFDDGPPCLQMMTKKELEDGRDRWLYNYMVFAKKKYQDKWEEMVIDAPKKYFLKDYHIDYNPISKHFRFHFDCPKPLLKARIYDRKLKKSYSGILGNHGEMMDPSFEVVLRQEKMLSSKLPFMAINWDDLVAKKQIKIVQLMDLFSEKLKSSNKSM